MNSSYDKELSAIFASDSDALVDEEFVQRCVTAFRRAERRLLVLKLIIVCVAVSSTLSAALAALNLAAFVPGWLSAAFAALDSTFGGIDRAAATGFVLVLVVRRYGFRLFRFRESQT